MPEISVKHIVSCSSEDRNNPAENLLKSEGTHKWRTARPGEKTAAVELQFEKASQIHSIDIGNEGSAFVEILVGKSTSDQDYQVLLVSSSFMSPGDSRNGTNRNTVRIFGQDKLTKTAAMEKWDRVKIVCTQPFNKMSTYGLSFIKFHSPPDPSKRAESEGVKKLGAFMIKNEDEEDDIKVGTLFSNRGQKEPTPVVPKGAAAVRAASRLAEEARAATPQSSKNKDTNSSHTGRQVSPARQGTSRIATPAKQTSPRSPAKASLNKGKEKHALSDDGSDTEEERTTPSKAAVKRKSNSLSSVASSHSSDLPPPLKKSKTEPVKQLHAKEFSKPMEKVVFLLSGFQNPYRGELREKALEMGAQYRPDWGQGCTHLVCAFTNTPKYNQVKGQGRIVSKEWILDCYKQKKLLPWRRYRMGDAESPGGSSGEDDVSPAKPVPISKNTPSSTSSKGSSSSTPQSPKQAKKISSANESDDDVYGGETDSPDDTDEEIRRAKVKADFALKANTGAEIKAERLSPAKARQSPEAKTYEKVDATLRLYADSTDEDEPNLFSCSTLAVDDNTEREDETTSAAASSAADHKTLAATVPVDSEDDGTSTSSPTVAVGKGGNKATTSDTVPVEDDDDGDKDSDSKCKATVPVDDDDLGLPDLPDFFAEMHFFLYGSFGPQDRRLLSRYIAAYNGVLEDYMNKRVKFVITCEHWDDNFEEALSENSGLIFVKPEWIEACHEKGKIIPYQPFIVVP